MRRVLALAVLFAFVMPIMGLAQTGGVDPDKWDEDEKTETKKGEEKKTESEWKTAKTKFKMMKKFKFTLPPVNPNGGAYTAVPDGSKQISTRLPLPSPALTTTMDGRKLGIDLNGDMKPDTWCKGAKLTTTVMLTYPDGKKVPYGVEIVRSGKTWLMSRSCARVCKIGGATVMLIDNDSDGYYDKFGTDAMIVGGGSYAQYLSNMVAVKGKVYEVKLNRAGTEVQYREWTGQSGKVNLSKEFKATGKLAAALLTDGNRCFNAAKPATIPVGTYTLTWGVVVGGGKLCHFTGSKTVEVKAEGTASLKFGGPFKMDFQLTKAGTKITVPASGVTVSDGYGYTYYNFNRKLLPHIAVRDKKTKAGLCKGKIGTG